jgi:leucyl aminopeptidase
MKNTIVFLGFFYSFPYLMSQPLYISTSIENESLLKDSPLTYIVKKTKKNQKLIEIKEEDLPKIANLLHGRIPGCGGFFVEKQNDFASFAPFFEEENSSVEDISLPIISKSQQIQELIDQAEEDSIKKTISSLSSFKSRYYNSPSGVASQKWIESQWSELIKDRADAKVSLIIHKDWAQPSVKLTITGTSKPSEKIILGGHGDSISDDRDDIAPGADDNASGISAVTEIIRILGKNPNIKPNKTIIFYSYAAEEVGLRGSYEIAKAAKLAKEDIKAVLQLDMTNFHGSPEEIVFISDYTSSTLTGFGENILTTYLPKILIGKDRCGYACSDHASWHRLGYPSIFPFESKMNDSNPHIHTRNDTIDQSQGHAFHALLFAQFGLSFALEMAGI